MNLLSKGDAACSPSRPQRRPIRRGTMGAALPIRDQLTPEALRRRARHEPNRRAALRMLAIANALEGMSRAEAARLAGMERQALRDAVVRYNAEGLAGLHDRPKPGRPERLSEAEQAALAARVFRGPDPERDGVVAWTRADLGGWLAARFGNVLRMRRCTSGSVGLSFGIMTANAETRRERAHVAEANGSVASAERGRAARVGAAEPIAS